MDLLQIWCMEWSQWPDKQLRSQSAGRVVRRSGGQFSALIAKSREQVGGGWRAVVVVQLPVYEGWLLVAAGRPLHSRSRSRYNPCAAAIQSQSTAARHHRPVATKPRNVCQAVTNSCQKLSPTAAKLSPCPKSSQCSCTPFHTSLVDHLSSSCQSQDLAVETFGKK